MKKQEENNEEKEERDKEKDKDEEVDYTVASNRYLDSYYSPFSATSARHRTRNLTRMKVTGEAKGSSDTCKKKELEVMYVMCNQTNIFAKA